MSNGQPSIKIILAAPDAVVAKRVSEIIIDNFAHDPIYRDYAPEILDSYIATNTPERVMQNIINPDSQFFVAYEGERVVGAILLRFYPIGYPSESSTNAWRIRRMHVAADCRGMRIAMRLADQAEQFVASLGYPVIYAEPTPEAAPFFTKRGWEGYYTTKPVTYTDAKGVQRTIAVPRFIAHIRLS